MLFFIPSIFLAIYDIKTKRVPNKILFLLLLSVTINSILNNTIKSGIISGSIVFLQFIFVYILTKGKIGMGDIKYTTISAIYLGYERWLYSIVAATILSLVFTGILYLTGRIDRTTKIPFIPFLVAGLLPFL